MVSLVLQTGLIAARYLLRPPPLPSPSAAVAEGAWLLMNWFLAIIVLLISLDFKHAVGSTWVVRDMVCAWRVNCTAAYASNARFKSREINNNVIVQ